MKWWLINIPCDSYRSKNNTLFTFCCVLFQWLRHLAILLLLITLLNILELLTGTKNWSYLLILNVLITWKLYTLYTQINKFYTCYTLCTHFVKPFANKAYLSNFFGII